MRALRLLTLLHGASAMSPTRSFPTPPHSGYHMKGRAKGFEGWYHRLTLDDTAFSFIYSIFDSADATSPRHGVGMQVCGPEETVTWCEGPANGFWADGQKLALGHSFRGVAFSKIVPPAAFERFVQEGFQLSSTRHQGRLHDGSAAWSYEVVPQVGWGGPGGSKQYSTAGWLAAFPVFEPMYQVVMAHGLASGYIEWRGQRRVFRDAPVYDEKNWGGSFPRRWWWVQCNAFERRGLTLTCACGERGNPLLEPLLPGRTDDACMVAVHDADGTFYPFANNAWDVTWGAWSVEGALDDLRIRVEATCDANAAASVVRCPAADGMTAEARERFDGSLSVRLWRVAAGTEDETELILESTSNQAAVEVGGEGWDGGGRWKGSCEVEGAARAVLSADVPLERFREAFPGL